MPVDDDAKTVFGRVAFAVFLTVIVLIAMVLISQRIPKSERPTFRHPVSTTIITKTPSAP